MLAGITNRTPAVIGWSLPRLRSYDGPSPSCAELLERVR